jgi:hypothetical protein
VPFIKSSDDSNHSLKPNEVSSGPRHHCTESVGSCNSTFSILARPAKAHQCNVVVLAAASGGLLDGLDYSLSQFPRGEGAPLYGGMDSPCLQLDVVDVR